jgi:hypothetical protein
MSPQQLFSILNLVALISWILLAIFPRRRLVVDVIAGRAVPIVFAVVYAAILVGVWGRTEGGFSSLADVAALFSNPWALLAGWVHYLAFDLLTGVWEVRDATSKGVPHWLVVPCLALTFMFGPAGWLGYMIVRTVKSEA